jgi:hypothetical protein
MQPHGHLSSLSAAEMTLFGSFAHSVILPHAVSYFCVLFSVTGYDSMTATDCTNSSSREWWSCIVHDTSRTSGYPPWVPQDVGGSKAPVVIVELKVSFVFLCVSVSVCLLTVVIRATATSTVLCIQSLLTLWAINWMLISSVVKSLPHTMLPTYMCNLLHVFLVQFL